MIYYMHRIQRAKGTYTKGIEVHNTLDAALLSFWGRMKLAYGKSDNDFVSCKITDGNGNIVKEATWKQKTQEDNKFFLHHIRMDGDTVDKAIDILDSIDTAKGDLAAQMEYGYGNTRYPNVKFVCCYITDLLSGGTVLQHEAWSKPQAEPEPEPTSEPELESTEGNEE